MEERNHCESYGDADAQSARDDEVGRKVFPARVGNTQAVAGVLDPSFSMPTARHVKDKGPVTSGRSAHSKFFPGPGKVAPFPRAGFYLGEVGVVRGHLNHMARLLSCAPLLSSEIGSLTRFLSLLLIACTSGQGESKSFHFALF